jgi:DNA-binding MarR family transcriptional regulator
VPEPYRRKPGKSNRPSPAVLGVVRVDPDFQDEYPGGDASSTEAYASLVRAGNAVLHEIDRRVEASFDMAQAVGTVLAVLDGAGRPLTPTQISDRLLVASATMTANLDVLERRGWIRRLANPDDRRSTLVEITPEGRTAVDRLLTGIRQVERSAMETLTKDERVQLLDLLAKVMARIADMSTEPPELKPGERIRPARLAPGSGNGS